MLQNYDCLSVFFMFQICFHVGGNKNNQGLTFLAIGDFGGISRPPYATHMQRKVAEVMGQVILFGSGTHFRRDERNYDS